MDVESRLHALERRCRLLTGCLVCLATLACAGLMMGAADSKKTPAQLTAQSFILVDGKGKPRARLFSDKDNVAFTLLRGNGEVGAWMQVTNGDAIFNMPRPGNDQKTGVVMYSSTQHEGVGITSPEGDLRWHSPE